MYVEQSVYSPAPQVALVQGYMGQYQPQLGELPPHLYRLMNHMLPLEPVLVQGLRGAVEVHSALWDQEGTLFVSGGKKK